MDRLTLGKTISESGIFIDGDWIESKDQNPDGEVRIIQLADIGDGNFINKSNRFMTQEKARLLQCTFLKPGDILIARMPDPIGRACILPDLGIPCVTAVDICVLRIDPAIVRNKWLKYMINSKQFRNNIDQYVSGATRKRISRSNLAKIEFDVPSLADQDKVIDKLDQASALIQKRKEAINLLDEYLKSVFLDMFGDLHLNNKGWVFGTLGESIDVLTDYHANGSYEILRDNVKLLSEPSYALMVRTTDLENNNFVKEVKYIDEHAYRFLEKSKVYGGEIIVNKIGSAGKVYLMPKLNRPVSLGMNAFLIRMKDSVNTEFMYYLLTSDYGKDIIAEKVQGAVTKTIRKDAIRSLKVPNIPYFLQKDFAKICSKVIEQKTLMNNQLEDLQIHLKFQNEKSFNVKYE